jgi:hypothetical protein
MRTPSPEAQEPVWKKLKLSLERPYKDDNGNPILPLLDVFPDGQQVFEPYAYSQPCSLLTRINCWLQTP